MSVGFGNYDRFPETAVSGRDREAFQGYGAVCGELGRFLRGKERPVLVLECYPGTDCAELLEGLRPLGADTVLNAEDCMPDREAFQEMLRENLTEDRVFGVLTAHRLEDYFLPERLAAARERLGAARGLSIVYGTGASLVAEGDALVYCDLARWEIQLRYRKGMPNLHAENGGEPQLSKYKRGYFVDWRLADRRKKELFSRMDYLLDTNAANDPKLVRGEAFLDGLRQTVRGPFRVVPYFDPGVWGGQWMKEVCGLPEDAENYAWSFDGVPEENSLFLRYGGVRVEVPAIDAVFYQPDELLGERVRARFGEEFPIRFDFLDTMGGQNLSLQVHPLTGYIQERFGMHYTQDESYYFLDCGEDACVYLGLREGVDREEMLADLRAAERGERPFDAERYVNRLPVKRHDHVLIPAGTVHCSGKNAMVLEISATPYIFTFKLWDWGRLGLDGLPRPIHLDHGARNIRWDRTTPWVLENLVGRETLLWESGGVREERTGLHELEFLETRRHTFTGPVRHHTGGSVNMLNLVEGSEAEVVSPTGAFAPFAVHYAETFLVPACVGGYVIRPTARSRGETLVTVKASVRCGAEERACGLKDQPGGLPGAVRSLFGPFGPDPDQLHKGDGKT